MPQAKTESVSSPKSELASSAVAMPQKKLESASSLKLELASWRDNILS